MSKLGIEQKTVRQLLGDNKADFLIPDYQRPYAWEEKECQTLWDDIFAFASARIAGEVGEGVAAEAEHGLAHSLITVSHAKVTSYVDHMVLLNHQ